MFNLAQLSGKLLESDDDLLPQTHDEFLPTRENCPPTNVHPNDLHQALVLGDESVELCYASEIIGVTETDTFPYHLFYNGLNDNLKEDEEFVKGMQHLLGLIFGDDECDAIGIKYIGKFLNHFCNRTDIDQYVTELVSYIMSIDNNMIKLATKWSGCDFHRTDT